MQPSAMPCFEEYWSASCATCCGDLDQHNDETQDATVIEEAEFERCDDHLYQLTEVTEVLRIMWMAA